MSGPPGTPISHLETLREKYAETLRFSAGISAPKTKTLS